jgi:hypothetical protein
MRKLRLIGVAGLTVAASMIPAAGAEAKDKTTGCPNGYEPTPAQALPPGQFQGADANQNGVVCAKGPQGNGHFNVKDDKGNTVSPSQWSISTLTTNPIMTLFMVTNFLDPTATYTLDPAPVEVVDDTPVN